MSRGQPSAWCLCHPVPCAAQGINVTSLREIKLLREIKSPYVVDLLDVFPFKKKLTMVRSTACALANRHTVNVATHHTVALEWPASLTSQLKPPRWGNVCYTCSYPAATLPPFILPFIPPIPPPPRAAVPGV